MSNTAPGLGDTKDPVRGLILTPDRDKEPAHDWSGAFRPEARALAAIHRIPAERIVQIDTSLPHPRRLAPTLAAIGKCADLQLLAILSHGWRNGFQLGATKRTVRPLAEVIQDAAAPGLAIVLYCCSTGEGEPAGASGPGGEGGFADALRDALREIGMQDFAIDAHTCEGHTTRNPYVRRFLGSESYGGDFLVAPDSPLWSKWRKQLRDTDLRFRFPLMARQAIEDELRA